MLLVAAVVLTLGAGVPVRAEQPPMVIDYPDFWPFFTRGEDGEMVGFFYEIVDEALGRMGIEATWRTYPWGRCQDNVRQGLAQGMVTAPTPERLVYSVTHEHPFYHKDLVVFTYKNHPLLKQIRQIRSIDDILDLDLSVVTYVGNGWNDRNVRSRGIKVYETPMLPNVWLMLAHRRADLVIEWPGGAWPDIIKGGVSDQIVETGVTLQSMPFHFFIGKQSPHAKRINEFGHVIDQMREEGVIDQIVDKYVMTGEGLR